MTFLKVNYSSCFSPSDAFRAAPDTVSLEKEKKRSTLLSPPPTITQALPCFVSFSPSLPPSCLIFLSNCFTLQRLRMGRSKKGMGYYHSNDASSCALVPSGAGLVVALCEPASADRLAVFRSIGNRKGLLPLAPLVIKRQVTGVCGTLWFAAPPEPTVTFSGTKSKRILRLTVTPLTCLCLFASFLLQIPFQDIHFFPKELYAIYHKADYATIFFPQTLVRDFGCYSEG